MGIAASWSCIFFSILEKHVEGAQTYTMKYSMCQKKNAVGLYSKRYFLFDVREVILFCWSIYIFQKKKKDLKSQNRTGKDGSCL